MHLRRCSIEACRDPTHLPGVIHFERHPSSLRTSVEQFFCVRRRGRKLVISASVSVEMSVSKRDGFHKRMSSNLFTNSPPRELIHTNLLELKLSTSLQNFKHISPPVDGLSKHTRLVSPHSSSSTFYPNLCHRRGLGYHSTRVADDRPPNKGNTRRPISKHTVRYLRPRSRSSSTCFRGCCLI